MTRDFSKQRRDDARSSSRKSPSGRYGEERSPRPARPRLNREAVDRAWENGAPQNHADYRTGRNNRNNQNPRYRSTNYGVRDSGNSRFNDQRGRGYSDRTSESASPRGFRQNPRYRDSDDQYRDRNANREYEHQGRDFDRSNRYGRNSDRDDRSPRNVDRSNRRSPSRGTRGPDTQNPRWQSRPPTQRGTAHSRPGQNFPRHRPQEEQFEGDYERFDAPEAYQHPGQFRGSPPGRSGRVANKRPARPVTPLRNGRVLKGPRPVQRKNAQFWNEIADETDTLLDAVHPSPADLPEGAPAKQKKPKVSPKPSEPRTAREQSPPRKHTASAVAREKKARTGKTSTRKKAPKPRSTGPKPSQRGFKWPAP